MSNHGNVRTERTALATPDGDMQAYVARPAAGSPRIGILVFQEAFGVNGHIREVTERFAEWGFLAISPELFHRTAPPGFEAAYGDFDAVRPHVSAVDAAALQTDARAAYEFLCARGASRVAAVGFCMGGRAAYVANAHLPLEAAISFYGGGIAPGLLDLAPLQHAPILMFWGGADAHIPAEQYRAVADALTQAGREHEQVVFSAAGHGFFCDARESFHPAAAAQAWHLSTSFLRTRGFASG